MMDQVLVLVLVLVLQVPEVLEMKVLSRWGPERGRWWARTATTTVGDGNQSRRAIGDCGCDCGYGGGISPVDSWFQARLQSTAAESTECQRVCTTHTQTHTHTDIDSCHKERLSERLLPLAVVVVALPVCTALPELATDEAATAAAAATEAVAAATQADSPKGDDDDGGDDGASRAEGRDQRRAPQSVQ